jgi:HEAT repeat protein
MAEKEIPFQNILNTLQNPSANLPSRLLSRFSDIPAADLAALMEIWPQLPARRKQTFLGSLALEYEDNTQYSFKELALGVLGDPDPSVRMLALRLLDDLEEASLLPRFLELLRTDPDADVRAGAATALGQFVQLTELEKLSPELGDQLQSTLIQAARTDSPYVRRAAIQSLGYSGRQEVDDLIEDALAHHDPQWVASGLMAAGRSANPRWRDDVLSHMRNDDREIRLAAVEAAGELGLAAARPLLFEIVEDEDDDDVFTAIVWSLSQIGGEDVRPFIETLLDQAEDDDTIEFLEEALMNLEFTEDMEGFDLLAVDPDDELDLDDER